METPPTPLATPYGSATEVPLIAEMLEQIQGAKVLTRLLAREQRPSIMEVEAQVLELCAQVDAFYELLGDRNWIYSDNFHTETIGELIQLPADAAERALINWYKKPETLQYGIVKLRRFPELRVRMHQIERAVQDFSAERYYATVQGLLSVMDGFVNDVERENRRGLHARDADELHAWNSVVGHHMGLTHAHRSFTTSFKKTVTEEVFELYRHGIVHGMVINFDNDVVAAKAWNRLFAVADWATSLERAAVPPEPKPTWRGLLQASAENRDRKRAIEQFHPLSLGAEAADSDHEVIVATRSYLSAWQAANFGQMAELLTPNAAEPTHGQTAGMIRTELLDEELESFTIQSFDAFAAGGALVDVEIVVNGERKEARLRWLRCGQDGHVVAPNEPGTWGLTGWTPWAMVAERKPRPA